MVLALILGELRVAWLAYNVPTLQEPELYIESDYSSKKSNALENTGL